MNARHRSKGRRDEPATASVVRRPRGERKGLEPEFEALAAGEVDRLGGPARRPRLTDPRPQYLVPGVANRDARAVFDHRVRVLETLAGAHREDPDDRGRRSRLGVGLAEAAALGLWRGRSLTSFDALAEQLLEIPADAARGLAREAAGHDDLHPFSEETVAIWMRAEAALLEQGEGEARIRARRDPDGTERLSLDAESVAFAATVSTMAGRLRPLAREVRPTRPERPSPRGPRRGPGEPRSK